LYRVVSWQVDRIYVTEPGDLGSLPSLIEPGVCLPFWWLIDAKGGNLARNRCKIT